MERSPEKTVVGPLTSAVPLLALRLTSAVPLLAQENSSNGTAGVMAQEDSSNGTADASNGTADVSGPMTGPEEFL